MDLNCGLTSPVQIQCIICIICNYTLLIFYTTVCKHYSTDCSYITKISSETLTLIPMTIKNI